MIQTRGGDREGIRGGSDGDRRVGGTIVVLGEMADGLFVVEGGG